MVGIIYYAAVLLFQPFNIFTISQINNSDTQLVMFPIDKQRQLNQRNDVYGSHSEAYVNLVCYIDVSYVDCHLVCGLLVSNCTNTRQYDFFKAYLSSISICLQALENIASMLEIFGIIRISLLPSWSF